MKKDTNVILINVLGTVTLLILGLLTKNEDIDNFYNIISENDQENAFFCSVENVVTCIKR